MIDPAFWSGKRVFLTGHTGFKGAWMSLVLSRLGSQVHGYALPPQDKRDLFVVANVGTCLLHTAADVRDLDALKRAMAAASPDIVIHMAAQALVRPSYDDPIGTYSTNVMGTANVLEAARGASQLGAVVIVTTDKCYEDNVPPGGYAETDRLGGFDPYSSSKACAELVTSAYRNSFYRRPDAPRIASARAGNVIGGGDWAQDRLVPDAIRAFMAKEKLCIRSPAAVRPWQHVMDPVLAYLLLAERLYQRKAGSDTGWNFGPDPAGDVTVETVVTMLCGRWGERARWTAGNEPQPHESAKLILNCTKAKAELSWQPVLDLDRAVQLTAEWYWSFYKNENITETTLAQIDGILTKSGSSLQQASR